MDFKAERQLLEQFIDTFDTAEFSSTTGDIKPSEQDVLDCQQRIDRYKAKLERKRKMEQSLKQTLEDEEIIEDSSIIITQEQIDDLLAKAGL